MKKKKIIDIRILIALIIICSLSFYFINERNKGKLQKTPEIAFKSDLNVNVNNISFERNGLYINNQYYNSKGISWYSKLISINEDKEVELKEIVPPFNLKKKQNNDTLYILKGNNKFYLLVTKEQNKRH